MDRINPAQHSEVDTVVTDQTTQHSTAEALIKGFHDALEHNLRNSVVRVRLYLEDNRTVDVLVGHIQDRIGDEYARFRETLWNMFDGALRESLLSPVGLRDGMRNVCAEGQQATPGPS